MTKEEKIKILKSRKEEAEADGYVGFAEALGSAIKALEQESVLDKIRAELETIISKNHPDWIITDLVPIDEVLDVIDKYKAESEVK